MARNQHTNVLAMTASCAYTHKHRQKIVCSVQFMMLNQNFLWINLLFS